MGKTTLLQAYNVSVCGKLNGGHADEKTLRVKEFVSGNLIIFNRLIRNERQQWCWTCSNQSFHL